MCKASESAGSQCTYMGPCQPYLDSGPVTAIECALKGNWRSCTMSSSCVKCWHPVNVLQHDCVVHGASDNLPIAGAWHELDAKDVCCVVSLQSQRALVNIWIRPQHHLQPRLSAMLRRQFHTLPSTWQLEKSSEGDYTTVPSFPPVCRLSHLQALFRPRSTPGDSHNPHDRRAFSRSRASLPTPK